MKRCPSCQSTYTDNSLRFCLSDGTPLVAVVDDDPQATKISPAPTKANMPTLALPPNQLPDYISATAETQQRPASAAGNDNATQRRRIIPILIVGLVLLASAVVVALVVTRDRSDDDSGASRKASDYPTSNSTPPQPTPSIAASPTPSATVTPSATPVPTVTPTPNDSYSARAEVMSALNAWTASLNRQDLDANMRLYADNLDNFYGRGNLSKASVRMKRRANFEMYYSSINVQLSNVNVSLDSSGTVATILYDNTYNWQGGTKSLRGKSHNKMVMSKIGGRWLITSEQHLQTYYEN
ncbi:MAG TPA: nuclear transport factor 2 family protein [Pyrinomonadaceae bacterium]|jgi:ketosteroid isomerase-like protein